MTGPSVRPAAPISADNPKAAAQADADVASARRVIELEAAGLQALAASLDHSIARAIEIFAAIPGRVIVTGMGKSGHIGNKIVATLASTGTPAFFVHPAEASHGDLGMITKKDAVLAMSNSGETSELADVVDFCKRFEIPLVAMTAKSASTLAGAADVALVVPPADEACPMGLAPTTSSTVMLALGDAIAVALLERKGFSPDDFHALHPGGKLGRILMKVRDLMHGGRDLPVIGTDASMSDALIEMTAKGFGCVGVVDGGGMLAGVITDGDLRRRMSADLTTRPATDIMTRGAKSLTPETLASEALHFMNENAITNVFVVADGKPVGVLHIHDCLRAGVA